MRHTLLSARVCGVDPEPGAVAATLGAGGQLCRHGKVGEAMEDTGVVDAEHSKVLWMRSKKSECRVSKERKERANLRLDLLHVGLVGDSERAALQVVRAGGVVLYADVERLSGQE
jgi:hypothetical protein